MAATNYHELSTILFGIHTIFLEVYQEFHAEWMRLRSRSSARCRSTGGVLTDSSVQNAMAKIVKSTKAWADTHWMIYWTRKVAKTTPMPTQESWSHQGSLGRASLVGGSPTHASAMSHDSITTLWSVDGATLVSWSIVPALLT